VSEAVYLQPVAEARPVMLLLLDVLVAAAEREPSVRTAISAQRAATIAKPQTVRSVTTWRPGVAVLLLLTSTYYCRGASAPAECHSTRRGPWSPLRGIPGSCWAARSLTSAPRRARNCWFCELTPRLPSLAVLFVVRDNSTWVGTEARSRDGRRRKLCGTKSRIPSRSRRSRQPMAAACT